MIFSCELDDEGLEGDFEVVRTEIGAIDNPCEFEEGLNCADDPCDKGVQFTDELPDGPLEAKFDMIRVVCCRNLFVWDLNLCTLLLF